MGISKNARMASLACAALLCLALLFGCTQPYSDKVSAPDSQQPSSGTAAAPSVTPPAQQPASSPPAAAPKKEWITNAVLAYNLVTKDYNTYRQCIEKSGTVFQATGIIFDFQNEGSDRIQVNFRISYDGGAKGKETAFSYFNPGEKRRITEQIDDCWNRVTIEAYNFETKELLDSKGVLAIE